MASVMAAHQFSCNNYCNRGGGCLQKLKNKQFKCMQTVHVVEDGEAGSPFQEALAFQNRSPSQNISATLSMRLNTQSKSLTRYVLATHFFVLVAFLSFLDTRWDYFDKESSQRPFKAVQRQKPPQFHTILIFCTQCQERVVEHSSRRPLSWRLCYYKSSGCQKAF